MVFNLSEVLKSEFNSNKKHPVLTMFLPTDNDELLSSPELTTDSPDYFRKINLMAISELLRQNSLQFFSEVLHNKSLEDFLRSYFAFRKKILVRSDDMGSQEVELDQKVVHLMGRIFEFSDDLCMLSNQSSPNLQVIPASQSIKHSVGVDEKSLHLIREQYIQILSVSIPFLKFPFMMDLISIMGESNIPLSMKLVSSMFEIRPILRKELAMSLMEIFQAVSEITSSAIKLRNSDNGNNGGKSKAQNIEKKGQRNNGSKNSDEVQLLFLCSFTADVVYSMSCFLEASQHLLHDTCIFSSTNGLLLSKQYGFNLFSMYRKLYEIAIPVMEHVIYRIGSQTESQPDDPNVQLCKEYINLSKFKSLKSIKTLLHVSYENSMRDVAAENNQGLPSEGVAWIDVVQSKLDITDLGLDSDVEEVNATLPILLSDYLQLYGSEVLEAIVRKGHEMKLSRDSQYSSSCENIMSSLRVKNSLIFLDEEVITTFSQTSYQKIGQVPETESHQFASSSSSSSITVQESIEAIKSLFPELGEGFIEACLKVYNSNVDQVIDGILMDNLHPSLLLLDRRMQKVWVSKQDHKLEATGATYKSHMKERVRHMEKEQEYDSYLISKEYDDDYDDQFDENIAARKLPNPESDINSFKIENTALGTKKEPVKQKSSIVYGRNAELDKQISETRRLNSLIRDEEKEISFWEGMRNTNHADPLHGRSTKDSWKQAANEDGDINSSSNVFKTDKPVVAKPSMVEAAKTNQSRPVQKSGGGDQASLDLQRQGGRNEKSKQSSNSSSSSQSEKTKHRPKTFDKHHQKDKALRKMA